MYNTTVIYEWSQRVLFEFSTLPLFGQSQLWAKLIYIFIYGVNSSEIQTHLTQIDCLGGGEGGWDGDNGNVWGIGCDPGWSSHWKILLLLLFFSSYRVESKFMPTSFHKSFNHSHLLTLHPHPYPFFLHSFSFNLVKSVMPQGPQ